MKKVMDKKAQSTQFIILLLVGLAAAAIVIIGVMGGFDAIFGKIGLLPGNLEAAAQSCGISSSQNLKTSYCNEFKQVTITGKKQYVTCDYLENHAEFEKLSEACTLERATLAKDFCKTLRDSKLVNGKVCYVNGEGDDEWGVSKEHLS